MNCWLASAGHGDLGPGLGNKRPTAWRYHSLSSADVGDMGPELHRMSLGLSDMTTRHHHDCLASADLGDMVSDLDMRPLAWHHCVIVILFLR